MSEQLSGTTVLVTRPEQQAAGLIAKIEQAGGQALRFPTLTIESHVSDEGIAATLGDVSAYDIAIFISTNAVEHGARFIPQEGPRPGIAAIGPSTARALGDAGLAADIKAEHGFTSEALLREPAFEQVDGKRVVIFRGEGGRALLGRELERRGAQVTYAEVYKRERPDVLDADIEQKIAAGKVDAITATSAETLVNLYELAQDRTLDQLLECQLVTASERVVKKAAALGFTQQALLAGAPDDQALVDALVQWRSRQAPTDDTMTEQAPVQDRDNLDPQDEVADEAMTAQPDTGAREDYTAAPPPARRGGSALSLLAMLIALASATGTAWLWWQQQQQPAATDRPDTFAADFQSASSGLQNDIDAVERNVGKVQDNVDALREEIGSVRSEIAGLADTPAAAPAAVPTVDTSMFEQQVEALRDGMDGVTARMQNVEQSMDDVRGVSAAARDNWVRAEAEYFLQAANSRLQLARDPRAALAALEAADDRLESLGDPALFRVRQQIAAEIEALRSVPQTDVEGIAHTLNGLARQVDTLPLKNSTPQPYDAGAGEGDVEGDGALSRAKSAVLGALSSMISVKRTEGEVTPLLSRDEEFFLKRNLELQLNTARLALLRGDAANYEESLRTAREWIDAHFLVDESAVVGALETIDQLMGEQIAPDLPNISGSLRQLRMTQPAAEGDAA